MILNKVVPIYNDYKLEIDFEGWMTGKNIGLYRSVYKDPKGLERWVENSQSKLIVPQTDLFRKLIAKIKVFIENFRNFTKNKQKLISRHIKVTQTISVENFVI